ncbi:DUF6711 family protein [Anaerosporobacter sp.]|uniref:DUF6711 family protein n=1 Tax=Anaerosporobacter sp. TaxID=1872529 RepID=UPI00286F812A|nr:DUF6711 family protein [Anaerosporobacter sp.]
MAMIKIEGVSVKDPSSFSWSLFDLSSEDGAGRTLAGTATKDIVVQKRKLSVTWNNIGKDDAETILKQVNSKVFFSVTYPDAMTGTNLTKTFYVGDRKTDMKIWSPTKKLYKTLSFEIIEK